MERLEALVTPSLLEWSRLQARMTIEEAAGKVGRSPEELLAWEDGSLRPSLAQARKLAEVYRRSLAVFFLPEPPQDFETLRDFRRLPDTYSRDFSPELSLLLRTLSFRQEWLREHLLTEEYSPLDFVNSVTILHSPGDVAAGIRKTLSVTPNDQRRCRTREEALRMWIDRAELAGVFVSRESTIELEEARGFALADDMAPCIFVNSADSKAGQLFTLAHELAHLWIGISSVSNMEESGHALSTEADRIESFCNRVASLTILGEDMFEETWAQLEASETLEDRISQASSRLKVSDEVVARRLLDRRIISQQRYMALREFFHERWLNWKVEERARQKSSSGGPSYFVTAVSKNGYAFTRTVVGAYTSGMLSGRDASALLNAKVNNLHRLGVAAGLSGISMGAQL